MRWNWPRTYWIFPALLASTIVLRGNILAPKVLLWTDEFMSWYTVSGSFGTMLSATADTINPAPPLYFILAWFWSHVSGGSPVTLRLFSAFATASAVLVI